MTSRRTLVALLLVASTGLAGAAAATERTAADRRDTRIQKWEARARAARARRAAAETHRTVAEPARTCDPAQRGAAESKPCVAAKAPDQSDPR